MSKQTITIQFKNLALLWKFAQLIESRSLEIIAADKILICECSENDIAVLSQYGGLVVEDYHTHQIQNISDKK